MIVLITKHLKNAEGAIWEINCAKEEKVPLIGVYMKDATSANAPTALDGIKKIAWTWVGIADFVNNL